MGELGQQFRHDVPEGENGGVEHRQPEAHPQFIPIPSQAPAIAEYRDDCESREVPPSADEPGGGETHDFEGFIPESHGPVGLGMDVDVIADRSSDHTDLDALMPVFTRDARKEIAAANDEIMGVIRALGGIGHSYMRKRAKGLKAVVSEI